MLSLVYAETSRSFMSFLYIHLYFHSEIDLCFVIDMSVVSEYYTVILYPNLIPKKCEDGILNMDL